MRTSEKEIQHRIDMMVEYLLENGETHIEDMASYFSVSPLTIRRNLKSLQEQNIVLLKNNNIRLTDTSKVKWMRLKENETRTQIQKTAAALICPNDVCYINTSYTALGILKFLKDVPCTIITNNMSVANIERSPSVRVVLTGGELHATRSSLVGEAAIRMVSINRANKCFIGIDAISPEAGLSSKDYSEAALTQQMIDSCTGEVILVATSDKLNQSAPFFVAGLDKVDTFITDRQVRDMLSLYEIRDHKHVKIIFATA